jgi:hypothetical protein
MEGEPRGAGRVCAEPRTRRRSPRSRPASSPTRSAGRGDRDAIPDLATGLPGTFADRTVALDEGPRAETTLEALAKLRTVFASAEATPVAGKATGMGSVTAGNSSQTSDGAGALILVSASAS